MYVWVRKQESSHNPHYHSMLLLDGKKIQNKMGIMLEAERLWGSVNGCDAQGLVHYAENFMIRTDSPSYQRDIAQCVNYASYMAKVNTKGNAPHRQREYGYTQLNRFMANHPQAQYQI